MQNVKYQSIAGIEGRMSLSPKEAEAVQIMADLVWKRMRDPGNQKSVLPVLEAVLGKWSGDNFFKKLVKTIAMKSSQRFMANISSDPFDGGQTMAAQLGRLATLKLQIANENWKQRSANQDSLSAAETAGIVHDFMKNMDFGEIDELTENIQDGIVAQAQAITDAAIDYMGKLGALGPSIAVVINVMLKSVIHVLETSGEAPPDFVNNFITGLVHMINGKDLGRFIHLNNESTRSTHIGNLLMGDGKTPAFQTMAAEKAREFLPEIDPVILGKKKVGQAEIKEAVQSGLLDALHDFPAITRRLIEVQPLVSNVRIRTMKRRLQLLEHLAPEDFAQSVADGLKKIDAHDISVVIGSTVNLIATVYQNKPTLLTELLYEIVSALDMDEIIEVADKIVKDAVGVLKPAVGPVLPSLINALCDMLEPAPGTDASELNQSVDRLKGILNIGGGAK